MSSFVSSFSLGGREDSGELLGDPNVLFLVAEHFTFMVHRMYCVLYVQAITVLSCRLTKDEREAWCKKGSEVSKNVANNNDMNQGFDRRFLSYLRARLGDIS
jgi:hypothetical protein